VTFRPCIMYFLLHISKSAVLYPAPESRKRLNSLHSGLTGDV